MKKVPNDINIRGCSFRIVRKNLVRVFSYIIVTAIISANFLPLIAFAEEGIGCICEVHCHKDDITYECPICVEDYTKCEKKDSAGVGQGDGQYGSVGSIPGKVTPDNKIIPDPEIGKQIADQLDIPSDLTGLDKAKNLPKHELDKWHAVGNYDFLAQPNKYDYRFNCFSYFGQTQDTKVAPPTTLHEVMHDIYEFEGKKYYATYVWKRLNLPSLPGEEGKEPFEGWLCVGSHPLEDVDNVILGIESYYAANITTIQNNFSQPPEQYLNSNVSGWWEYYNGPYYAGYIELDKRPTEADPETYYYYAGEYTNYFRNMMYIGGTRWMHGFDFKRIQTILGRAEKAVDKRNNGWVATELYQNDKGEYGAVVGYTWSKKEVICPEKIYVAGLGHIPVIGLDVENHVIQRLYVPDTVLLIKRLQSASLVELTGMQGVEKINAWGFQNCAQLRAIPFMPNLTSIGTFAFESCVSLQNILLPNYMESIAWSAFGWYDYIVGNYDWGVRYDGSDFYEHGSTFQAMEDDDKIYGITLYCEKNSQTWKILDSMIHDYVYAQYTRGENGQVSWEVIGDDAETKASQKEWNGHLNLDDEKNYEGAHPSILCTIDPSEQAIDDDYNEPEEIPPYIPVIDVSDYTGQGISLLPVKGNPNIKVVKREDGTTAIFTVIAGVTLVTIITAAGSFTFRYGGGNEIPSDVEITEWWEQLGPALNFQGDALGALEKFLLDKGIISQAAKTHFALIDNGIIGMAQDYCTYRNNGDSVEVALNKSGLAAAGKVAASYALAEAGLIPAIWDTVMQEGFGGTDFGDRLGIYNNAGLFLQFGHDIYFSDNYNYRQNVMDGKYGFAQQMAAYGYYFATDFENEFNWLDSGWDEINPGDVIKESFIDKKTGKSIFDPYVNHYGDTVKENIRNEARNSKTLGSIIDIVETTMEVKDGKADAEVVMDFLKRQIKRTFKP